MDCIVHGVAKGLTQLKLSLKMYEVPGSGLGEKSQKLFQGFPDNQMPLEVRCTL